MKHLSGEKRAALKSWLREPAAETFAEVIERKGAGNPFDLRARITSSVDNHGALAHLIGRQDGFEEVLKEMKKIART